MSTSIGGIVVGKKGGKTAPRVAIARPSVAISRPVVVPARPAIARPAVSPAEAGPSEPSTSAVPRVAPAPRLQPTRRPPAAKTVKIDEQIVQAREQYEKRRYAYPKQLAALPLGRVGGVKFSLLKPEQIDELAVMTVDNDEETGLGSVQDTRMGVVAAGLACQTCGGDFNSCPGHPGKIDLPVMLPHPQAVGAIINILSSVCNDCGGLLLPAEQVCQVQSKGSKRLTEIKDMCERQRCLRGGQRCTVCKQAKVRCKCKDCDTCQAQKEKCDCPKPRTCGMNPVFKKSNSSNEKHVILFTVRRGKKEELDQMPIREVYKILDGISDEDARLLGFSENSHPRDLIMSKLLVAPPIMRPTIIRDGVANLDHLTKAYMDIVGHCNTIRKMNEEGRSPTSPDYTKEVSDLFFKISHMIDNSDGKYEHPPNKPVEGVRQRLDKKEGLVRDAMMGKRVDFTGRTVASPDVSLEFGQARIPRAMASSLIVREAVCTYNRRRLQRLLEVGQVNVIITNYGSPNAQRKRVDRNALNNYLDLKKRIEEGEAEGIDVSELRETYGSHAFTLRAGPGLNGERIHVERWLQEGDYVVINRQPTLHPESMMAYQVVFGDLLTIGMHLSVTTPLNLDIQFDC